MGGIVTSCDSGVIKCQKEVGREGEGGVAEGKVKLFTFTSATPPEIRRGQE